MLKNMHYFGNPVFPFFYAWGKAALNPWMHSGAQGYFRALVEYEPHSLLGTAARSLWSMAVNGFQFGGGADVLGDFGWTLLIAFSYPRSPGRKENARLCANWAAMRFYFLCAGA